MTKIYVVRTIDDVEPKLKWLIEKYKKGSVEGANISQIFRDGIRELYNKKYVPPEHIEGEE